MNENKQINKPLSVAKEEFATALIKLCNESQVPLFVIEYTLRDVLQEVRTLAKQQYEIEKQNYEQTIALTTQEPVQEQVSESE
jgi:hypothetical protein